MGLVQLISGLDFVMLRWIAGYFLHPPKKEKLYGECIVREECSISFGFNQQLGNMALTVLLNSLSLKTSYSNRDN